MTGFPVISQHSVDLVPAKDIEEVCASLCFQRLLCRFWWYNRSLTLQVFGVWTSYTLDNTEILYLKRECKPIHLANSHMELSFRGTYLWDKKTGYPRDLESVQSPVWEERTGLRPTLWSELQGPSKLVSQPHELSGAQTQRQRTRLCGHILESGN